MSFSRIALADEVASRLGSGKTAKLAKEVAAYLIQSNKTSELNSLERDIVQERAEKNRIVELKAITSHQLESKQLKDIERLVKSVDPACKEVVINQVIDESLIGGVRLEFANQLLDLSVSAKLNKLRKLTAK